MGFRDKKKPTEGEHEPARENAEARDADFSTLEGEKAAETNSSDQASHAGQASGAQSTESAASSGSGDSEVARLRAEIEEHKDRYLRALAELENYKKRSLKERSEMLKYQGERIIFDLLEVADNLELAKSHSGADAEKIRAGLDLIHKLFVDVLGKWEIRSSSAMGKEFDPTQHQAISKVTVDDTKPGTVINELKKAYFYKDKLLRPADVVVAVGREVGQDGADASESQPSDEPEQSSREAEK